MTIFPIYNLRSLFIIAVFTHLGRCCFCNIFQSNFTWYTPQILLRWSGHKFTQTSCLIYLRLHFQFMITTLKNTFNLFIRTLNTNENSSCKAQIQILIQIQYHIHLYIYIYIYIHYIRIEYSILEKCLTHGSKILTMGFFKLSK